MSSPQGASTPAPAGLDAYWLVPVLRAIPAIVVGLAITFTGDHSARIGLIMFGSFALASGLVLAVASARLLADRVTRGTFIAQGTIAVASGAASLVLLNGGLGLLLFIVTVFAALTGMLELYAGLRARRSAVSRDWLAVGVFTAVLAIVFVLIPAEPVLATGLIGAYALILGVYLVIAGLSLRWAAKDSAEEKVSA